MTSVRRPTKESQQGNPDSIRFVLRRFAGLRHDGYYVYAIAT